MGRLLNQYTDAACGSALTSSSYWINVAPNEALYKIRETKQLQARGLEGLFVALTRLNKVDIIQ